MNTHLKQLWAAMKLPEKLQKSYKFFCRELDIRVAQVVEPDMLQPRVLEDPLMECYDQVGVIHFSCSAGREHPRIVRVLGVLLLQ